MPGVEATAAAALLFWARVALGSFWRGFSGPSGVQGLSCLGWGVYSFPCLCSASLGRLSFEIKCVVCVWASHYTSMEQQFSFASPSYKVVHPV